MKNDRREAVIFFGRLGVDGQKKPPLPKERGTSRRLVEGFVRGRW